mmetsp:Transcript_24/g.63  ORF Transcript_24/g.63 Transcript_24/m.63 type:complete len:249 (+) Transcript_24:931-1677(+)
MGLVGRVVVGCVILVDPDRRVAHDLVLLANLRVLHAVHVRHQDFAFREVLHLFAWSLQIDCRRSFGPIACLARVDLLHGVQGSVEVIRQLLPRRREFLAVRAPRRVEVNEQDVVLVREVLDFLHGGHVKARLLAPLVHRLLLIRIVIIIILLPRQSQGHRRLNQLLVVVYQILEHAHSLVPLHQVRVKVFPLLDEVRLLPALQDVVAVVVRLHRLQSPPLLLTFLLERGTGEESPRQPTRPRLSRPPH